MIFAPSLFNCLIYLGSSSIPEVNFKPLLIFSGITLSTIIAQIPITPIFTPPFSNSAVGCKKLEPFSAKTLQPSIGKFNPLLIFCNCSGPYPKSQCPTRASKFRAFKMGIMASPFESTNGFVPCNVSPPSKSKVLGFSFRISSTNPAIWA